MENKLENICGGCEGKKAIRTKNHDICPYEMRGGKYQSDRPLAFKKGKVFYECQKLIKLYEEVGASG